MEDKHIESVKLVVDWSKWLASLQTAVITLVSYTSVTGNVSVVGVAQPAWIVAAVFSFFVSLTCAAFIMFAMPGIVHRLPPEDDQDVLTMGTYNGGGIRLATFCVCQFVFFALGAFFLAVWSVIQLYY